MPYADRPTLILGGDGFIGRNLVEYWRARGWPVQAVGRAAGDFTDPAVVEAAFRAAPRGTGRIIHAITKQRTGAIQYEMQGELLRDNAQMTSSWIQLAFVVSALGAACASPRPEPESVTEKKQLTRAECEASNATVVGDIGDGATQRPDYVCANGKPPLGTIAQPPDGPVAIEGEVCCPR